MEITFLTHYFFPKLGGVENHVLNLSKKLIEKGHEINIITLKHEPNLKDFEEYQNIKIFRLNNDSLITPNKKQLWWNLFKYISILKSSDIVHCHDVFFWYLPFKFILFSKPVFTTFHGYEGVYPPTRNAILIRKLSEKLSLGNMCVGDFIKKWYGTNPTIVTYGAVTSSILQKNEIHPSGITILFLGRLAEDTGLRCFCESISIIKRTFNISVLFCGDGPLKDLSQIHGNVLGYQKNVARFISNADLVFTGGYLGLLETYIQKKPAFCVYENQLKRDYYLMSPHKDFAYIADSQKKLTDNILSYLQNPNDSQPRIDKAFQWASMQTWQALTDEYVRLWTLPPHPTPFHHRKSRS